ncbi:glutathione S-transferase [Gorgonomyces haynaldii]|nr:glutathione S-transferase [Gorgonomyces haynaldii]
MSIKLYSYWRSSASWRIRIILALKQLDYEYIPVNLVKGEQFNPEYLKLNPGGVIPTLVIGNDTFVQSPSIAELLEELYPQIPLLPKDPIQRARVREMINVIACDTHPVQNLKVLKYAGDDRKQEWAKHFITLGFEALEKLLEKSSGKYSFGDQVTLADAFLVPQYYNALRWGVDLKQFPIINRVQENLHQLEAFQKAHADRQPDAQ